MYKQRERNAVRQLLKYAHKIGCSFSIWSGEEEGLCYYKGRDWKAAWANCAVEDSTSIVIHKDEELEWVYYVMGNAPSEAISDCTAYGFVDMWTDLTEFGQQDICPEQLSWEMGRRNFHKEMDKLSA